MKAFFDYFFGKGSEVEFINFSFAHLCPILAAVLLILLIYRYRDALRGWQYEYALRYTMAFLAIVSEMSYFWRLVGIP